MGSCLGQIQRSHVYTEGQNTPPSTSATGLCRKNEYIVSTHMAWGIIYSMLHVLDDTLLHPVVTPPIHLGDLLKLAVTVVLLVCLNILWLKTIAWGGKADGMCLGSVSGMQKLAGTFTSHNISRAKGTYQNWDLHRTHRHPSPKLWSCSAAPILLNSISIFQFKVFQIHWVTPQFMHSRAQVLADGNKSVSILQHWWGVIKHHWTLAYVSCVSTEMFQMEMLRLFTML